MPAPVSTIARVRSMEELQGGMEFGAEAQEPWRMPPFFLARLAEQMGDVARATAAYARFIDSWPEADPSLPILADARNRLAVLRSGAVEPPDRR
jgi:hypothetical protein